ncbi:extracellular solute-binding protein [Bacillus sp. REN16]|uniref:extracellular solute-binding protein n=1 Tax=Bacillus sp. REN16 TaxID=2887296 RepID=UPI001E384EC0|nr:extracellular solute-binding protein [Bacillus sp. REN16]MCC3357173.1 extracellular solute-binding protein [Bacillus sp. REN16]
MLRKINDFEQRYYKFLTELKNEILTGRIKPGEFILPENTLSKQYDLSRVSIRKVLAELVEEGLIEKIPGKGNRVTLPQETSKQTLTLAWFSDSYEKEIVEQIIKRFEQLNPFVKIELQLLPVTDYMYSVAQLIEHGHGPDLFIVSDYHFRELIETNRLDLLEPYIPMHLDAEKDSYQKVFDMFTADGNTIATPFVFSPVMICYNKRMFEEAGIENSFKMDNWDDLLTVASKCTKDMDENGLVDQYGFCFSSSSNRWPVFILQNNGQFMLEDRPKSVMNNPKNIEALSFCVDLMYKHKVSPIFSHGSNELAENLFMRERAAMILTTYYFMNEFRDHKIKWDVLPVPAKESKATLLLGGALGINAKSEMKEMAKALIDYMVSTEAQTMLKRNGCTIPILRFVAEDNYLLQPGVHPDNYNAFKEIMPNAYTIRDLGLTTSETELVENELQLLWANMERTEDVCKRIEKILNEKAN